ncbi:MAG: hypothetical protein K0Q77_2703 [Anaerosporomusa subterranea]|nr:hypothetical protein [Anaerosporomusa subterranea]
MELMDNIVKGDQLWKINSVANSIRVLKCFTGNKPEWILSQLALELKMPKSTLLNMLRTLELLGLIIKNESNQSYRLGLELLEFGYSVRRSLPILEYAVPLLEDIQASTNKMVYFTVPRHGKVLYLEGIYPGKRTIGYSVTGKTLLMHCTGCGKAMLSQMREDDVKTIVNYYGLPQYTPTTITNYDDLVQELQRDRERGYSIDRSEETHGVKCVAVPIRSKERVLGAISISGSIISMQDEILPSYAEMLMDVSNLLSTKADLFPSCSILPQ